jgi:hypothetical protein
MARFKNYLLVVIGFAVAGAIGAAFGTGTAQAVVSTLVTAVNTSANPVPTSSVDATDPGRIAYQSSVVNSNKCSGNVCAFSFPTVPAGHRVVVQHIGGVLDFTAAPTTITVSIRDAASGLISGFSPIPTGDLTSAFDQSVLFYVEASNAVFEIDVALSGSAMFSGAGSAQVITLSGYELDCTVAACAPIATQ